MGRSLRGILRVALKRRLGRRLRRSLRGILRVARLRLLLGLRVKGLGGVAIG